MGEKCTYNDMISFKKMGAEIPNFELRGSMYLKSAICKDWSDRWFRRREGPTCSYRGPKIRF